MYARFLGHQPKHGDRVRIIAIEHPDGDKDRMRHVINLEATISKPHESGWTFFDLDTPTLIEGDPEPVTGWVFSLFHTVTLEPI